MLVGIATHDDAAVYRVAPDLALVATVDVFTPIVDDPYDFGRIAAANSLSDVYAMGARPLYALSIIGFPSKTMPLSVMEAILRGGIDKSREAGIAIVGGHSIDDNEPKYGLSVTGLVHPECVVKNSTGRAGDVLILTKPIGTGILSQGIKTGRVAAGDAATAIEIMATLNRAACDAMLEVGVHAATDVTGFGLLGHLHEVVHASGVAARLSAASVPLLPGALALSDVDVIPGGSRRNAEYFGRFVSFSEGVAPPLRALLFDAQTSGGLLMSVRADRAQKLLAALESRCVVGQAIGRLEAGSAGTITVET